jgi:hypothetical protein
METNQFIETIGSITKIEHLCSLEEGILPNSMVLRNIEPFPGVKDHTIDEHINLGSYFIILRYRYAPEKINRINCKLFVERNLSRYPSYGEIITMDAIFPCIRLKELTAKELVPIQDYLKRNDLQFMAYHAFDQVCRIKIFKSFRLTELADGLYRDLNDQEKFYIQFKGQINRKRFDFIVNKIKHTINNSEFDAALGVIYRFSGPQDVIRIYDNDKTLERALYLKKWFVSEIMRDIQISAMY